MLNFVKAFSASIEMIIWFFSFSLLIWLITLIDLHILKNPCIPVIKPPLIMMYDPFNVLLDSVCLYFVENFCIYVHERYWPVVFFLCDIFVWFWYQGDGGHVE